MEAQIGQGLFPCILCPLLAPFYVIQEMKDHYTQEHFHLREECSLCFNRFHKADIDQHRGIEGPRRKFYLCVGCYEKNYEPYAFATLGKIQGHNAAKHKMLKYVCLGCANAFGTKDAAKSHCKN